VSRWRVRRRSDVLLAVIDIGCAVLASWLAYTLRFQGDPPLPDSYVARYVGASVGLAVGVVVAHRGTGLYRRAALRPRHSNVEAAVESAVLLGIAVLLVNAIALSGDLSRAWIGLVTLFLILLAIASRWLLAHTRRALVPLGIGLERYALVGDDVSGRRLLGDLTRAPGAPFMVVEVLSRSLTAGALVERARTLHVDGLILPADIDVGLASDLASELSGAGIDVLLAPKIGELELRVASIAMLHGVPLLRTAGLSPGRAAVRTAVRRYPSRGVAIMGTRGIPANYGGFETFAERLAVHLVGRNIPVTVYCRRHYATAGREWRGVRLVTLPTIRNKYLDTVVHSALSTLHLITRTRIRDVVLCNAANAPVLPLLRVTRRRVVMNVDGLEWRRGKWGVMGRSWYRLGEWLSVRSASVLVTDAAEVRTYYRVRHDTDSVMVPYGADLLERGVSLPAELAVEPDGFVLYVSRWERENNPLLVARAHADSGVSLPLVMLGRATYDDALEREVRAAAAPHAVLPGPLFGPAYTALQSNARCYVHATEVGGTHPALIEAMGAGNLCLVLDTPENREVAGPDAWYFADAAGLADLLRTAADLATTELERLRAAIRSRAAALFSWATVGETYLDLITGGSRTGHQEPMPRA
jgi:glycosyltransferase involved in cell wall biosynthesis